MWFQTLLHKCPEFQPSRKSIPGFLLILRSVFWLSFRESLASFYIYSSTSYSNRIVLD
jgi:hypothetical protein